MITIKEYSTRIKGDQFTFKLEIDSNGLSRLRIEDHLGKNRIEDLEKKDIVGEHMRATASEFLTGSTI